MTTHYSRLTPELLSRLAATVGESRVLAGDPDKLEPFGRDETTGVGDLLNHPPEAVVFPESEAEVAAIVRFAATHRIPLTPRGGGTGLAGGAVPRFGGIVISLTRMNRIVEIDPANFTVTAEPGVIVKALNGALAGYGLTFPCFPISYEHCTIGGNVATNAGGGKAVKYGVTGRYVLGLRAVSPTGEILELGGKLRKNTTGYNLIPLLTGSEGTLGILTELTLAVIPAPPARLDFLALFDSDDRAIRLVAEAIASTGVVPASIEYVDRLSIETTARFLNDPAPYPGGEAALLFSFDGYDAETVAAEYEKVLSFVRSGGALAVEEGRTPEKREALWRIRKHLAEAFRAFSPYQTCEDIVVPVGEMAAMFAALRKIAGQYGVLIPIFGHAGDGNLHPRIVAPPDWTAGRWAAALPAIQAAMFEAAGNRGGQISGEHGLGMKRNNMIRLTVPESNLAWMRSIKTALDPLGIMNPGKVF